MLIIVEKSNNHIVGYFSSDQKIEDIYRNNQSALDRLSGVYADDALVPSGNIRDYKFVKGTFIKIPHEEKNKIQNISPIQQQIANLKKENALLYSAIAELSLLLGSV